MRGAKTNTRASTRSGDVEVRRNCAIPVTGATELAADVYLPRGETPCPALVTLIPYQKDGIAGITGWEAHHALAARGYACVLVDMAGTGSSGGLPRAPFHHDDGADGFAAVEWAAAQEWCNGSVGMWGVSYGATTALRTATLRPPSLRAIAAVMGFLDPERDFVHPEGRHGCLASFGTWVTSTLSQHLTPPLLQDADGTWYRRWRERLEHGEPFLIDLLRHGPGDPEWRARSVDLSLIEVPTFCVAGWRDLACEPTIRAFEAVRGPKQLLVGPWMHTLPDESPFEAVGFLSLAADWWDRWLRGGSAAEEDGSAVVYVQGRGAWRRLPSWPPPAQSSRLTAGADAALVQQHAPAAEGIVERRVDPTVGVRGGLWSVPTRGFGLPRDQHEDDVRSITFTSAPLEAPVQICGRPAATLAVVREAGPERTLVVKITHVGGDGSSRLITSGTATLPAAAHRVEQSHRVEMIPTAYEVPAGDRLRFVVAGADFPRLLPDPVVATLAVRCGGVATRLDVPVCEFDDLEVAAPPPPVRDGAPASLVLRADPLYTVSHDAVTDGVTVTVGDHLLMKTPQEERLVDVNGHVSATVTTERPDAAHISGRSVVRVDTAHGEYVVRADVRFSRDASTISGIVTLDGRAVFERRWNL